MNDVEQFRESIRRTNAEMHASLIALSLPASRPRAFSDDRNAPPPDDWRELALFCVIALLILGVALLGFELGQWWAGR